jgi:cytochrome b6-f complex iron-sulfur subunit
MKRRHFLALLPSALAVGGSQLGCASDSDGAPAGGSGGGGAGGSGLTLSLADLKEGGFVCPEGAARLVVGRDAAGVYAFSSICTHTGCVLSCPAQLGDLVCPCHGSRFDANGEVLEGPATTPLRHYKVTVSAGIVSVDPATEETDRQARA